MEIIRLINNLLHFYLYALFKTQHLLAKILILNAGLFIALKFSKSVILPSVIVFLTCYLLYLSFRADKKNEFQFFYKINNIPAFPVFMIKLIVISVLWLISLFILLMFKIFHMLNIQ